MRAYTQDSRNKWNITWIGLGWYIVMTAVGIAIQQLVMVAVSVAVWLVIAGCLIFQLVRRKQAKYNVVTSPQQ